MSYHQGWMVEREREKGGRNKKPDWEVREEGRDRGSGTGEGKEGVNDTEEE